MRGRFSGSMTTGAVVVAGVGAVISVCIMPARAQAPEASAMAAAPTLKTLWGEPDLQGIWTDEFDTPLQRSAEYENQEFLSQAQRAELDRERRALLDRDQRGERGTEADVAGAYSFAVFLSTKHTGARTSLIVDPPNGRIPPLTPEAQNAAAADRESRRAEPPPRYNTIDLGRIKLDGPEDGALADRCLTGGLPEFGTPFGGSFRRIVQTPSGISMFYDVGQGQGWQRNIVMNGSPHLPGNIRQWYGDSRGHWEGITLVIDVTNFRGRARICMWSSAGHAPGQLRSNTLSRSKTRPCGRGHGLSSRTSPGRAIRKIGFITSRAASKETTAFRVCCMDDAWQRAPLRRDEALTRQLNRDDISCSPILEQVLQ
jgi:hypothetical protein